MSKCPPTVDLSGALHGVPLPHYWKLPVVCFDRLVNRSLQPHTCIEQAMANRQQASAYTCSTITMILSETVRYSVSSL